ncbi:protein Wnt-9a-like [Oratosquilla oratoria]|uniref:protein Wnt-9a-like n=1 Tax=Oratosquilla oratoria TaxID=337810 RepID=UPI003F769279
MSGRGVRRCRGSKEVAPFLLKAFLLSVAHCQRELRYDRWNCSLGKARRKILKKGFPESAFLLAISSASVTHEISKGCSTGRLSRCSCDDSAPAPENVRTWRWGGCGDNVKFGSKFSRKLFRRGRSKRRLRDLDFRAQVDQHNVEVGIRLVKDQATKSCKCHGVSGSCAIQTCWKQLAGFDKASSRLRELYRNAVMVSPSNVVPAHSGRKHRGRKRKGRKDSRRRLLGRVNKVKPSRRTLNSKRLRTKEPARSRRESGMGPRVKDSWVPAQTGVFPLGANDAFEGKVYRRLSLWGGDRHSSGGVNLFVDTASERRGDDDRLPSGREGRFLRVSQGHSEPSAGQIDSKKDEFLGVNDGQSLVEKRHDVVVRNPRGVPIQQERTQDDTPIKSLVEPKAVAPTSKNLAHSRAPEEVVRKKDRDLGPFSSYDRLLFVEKAQDFCRPTIYGPGTSGRECLKGRNCQELCCGRGYNTLLKNRTEACKCQVHWCCEVKCQTCVEQEEVYVCK